MLRENSIKSFVKSMQLDTQPNDLPTKEAYELYLRHCNLISYKQPVTKTKLSRELRRYGIIVKIARFGTRVERLYHYVGVSTITCPYCDGYGEIQGIEKNV